MNERIDELAFAAGCHRHKYWDPKHPDLEGFIINQAALDKFAELIVRECVKEIEFQYGGGSDQPMDNEWDRAIECVSSMVKYHFGVEE